MFNNKISDDEDVNRKDEKLASFELNSVEEDRLRLNENNGNELLLLNSTVKSSLRKYCNYPSILTPIQRRLCNSNNKIAELLASAAATAIEECQYQFKFRRWNCPVFNSTKVFGQMLTTKSRESAFIYAIGSAAIMYKITQACSKGDLNNCGCETQRVRKESSEILQQFKWGGCSDNVIFGHKFSQKFLDSKEYNQNKRLFSDERLMNLHNNEVGRRVCISVLVSNDHRKIYF